MSVALSKPNKLSIYLFIRMIIGWHVFCLAGCRDQFIGSNLVAAFANKEFIAMFNFMQSIQGEVSRREHRLPGVMDRSTYGRWGVWISLVFLDCARSISINTLGNQADWLNDIKI